MRSPSKVPRARGMPRAPEALQRPSARKGRKCRGEFDRERTGETGIPRAIGLSAFLHLIPGGLTLVSSAGGPSRLRRNALACACYEPPRKVPVTSGTARRNQTTSAAETPMLREHERCGQPHSRSALASALETPLGEERDKKEYSPITEESQDLLDAAKVIAVIPRPGYS